MIKANKWLDEVQKHSSQGNDELVAKILTSADADGKASVVSALTDIRLQLPSGELALNAARR